jgi:hypothetical protein
MFSILVETRDADNPLKGIDDMRRSDSASTEIAPDIQFFGEAKT